jgi:hypothetical protein
MPGGFFPAQSNYNQRDPIMKRALSALALAAATFASASVYAQNPQPSFQDSAPVPAAQTATSATAPAATRTSAAPLPSFSG